MTEKQNGTESGNTGSESKLKSLWGRAETKVAALVLAVLALIWVFLGLADAVGAQETLKFDRALLELFRRSDDPGQLIGPGFVQTIAQQATDLGSASVMALWTMLIAGYLVLDRQFSHAAQIALAAGGGAAIAWTLKHIYQRPRPEIVPRLGEVHSWSFPSGHANISIIIYLTLGILLARYANTRLQKIYVMGVACFLVLLIGWTRVALGVHYPSDVLAGWTAGLGWALVVWFLSHLWESKYPPANPEQSDKAP